MRKYGKIKLINDQRGVVSLFVTLIIMVVLSIVVLGFSQVSRREARSALDRQLSTQAFYAAESGVNDAYSSVATAVAAGGNPANQNTSCSTGNTYMAGSTPIINPNSNTQYTCLLVTTQPSYLSFHPSAGQAEISDLQPSVPGQIFSSIRIDWENDGSNGQSIDNTHGGCNNLYASGWNPNVTSQSKFLPNASFETAINGDTCPPVVKVDIVPINWAGGETATSLAQDVRTFYMYPSSTSDSASAGGAAWNGITNGGVYGAECTNYCQFKLSGMETNPNRPNAQEYYIRLTYIYGSPPSINLSATSTLGTAIDFSNSQLQVDATGKAQDILRRMKVVLALNPENVLTPPDYAIQSAATLCKRIEVGNVGATPTVLLNIPDIAPKDVISGVGGLASGTVYNLNSGAYNDGTVTGDNNPCDPF